MPKLKKNINSVSKRHLQRLAKTERDRMKNRSRVNRTIANFTQFLVTDVVSDDNPDSIGTFADNSNDQPNNDNQFVFNNDYSCNSESEPFILGKAANRCNDTLNTSNRCIDSMVGENANNSSQTDKISKDLGLELRSWASESCVSQKHLSSLLKILKHHGHDKELPSDARTLVKTPRTRNLIDMDPGKYYHVGLCDGLTRSLLSNYPRANLPDQIKFNTHIDGLPLSKSSGTQLWPVLVSIDDNQLHSEPFVVGAYVGNTKPVDSNDFLSYYVEDVKNIRATGVMIDGKRISADAHLFIGDAPAIAYVKCTKSFNARNGCGKCEVDGEYISKRMTFPDLNAPLRTDETFSRKTDDDYHKNTSILEKLEVGMVSAFPSESQHLVYQGVTKKTIGFAVKGKQGVRMKKSSIELAPAHLFRLRKAIPKEFARRPRPLHEIDRFKATEFRQLLLYTGPVIFLKRLDNDKYVHFLSLSVAIRILSSKEFHLIYNDYARTLLVYFVEHYGTLYGTEHITYNIHNLIHICDDVLRLGPLDNYSAFKYENYLGKLKKQIKNSGKELQQLMNRLAEKSSHQIAEYFVNEDYPIIQFSGQVESEKHFIKSLQYPDYFLNLKENNNCVYLFDGSIISIKSFYSENETVYISGRRYVNPTPMFETPCDSSILNIRVVTGKKFSLVTRPASQIKQKCVKLQLDGQRSAIFPLIHQD